MTLWTDFGSLRDYCLFALAREFVKKDDKSEYIYEKNRSERVGNAMLTPFFYPTDLFFRNIRNPLVILSMTATALALVSIGFYPTQFFAAVYHVAPFLKFVNPKTAKFTLYLSIQNIILGLGIRTLGRQNNEQLMHAFRARQLTPIRMGSVRF